MTELLRAQDLRKAFLGRPGLIRRGAVFHAVQGVSFSLGEGETLAIVGESGAGKSTVARLVLQLLKADAGAVFYRGQDISHWNAPAVRRWRRHVQLIAQDPYGSFDPRVVIGASVAEPLVVHNLGDSQWRRTRTLQLLRRVGMGEEHLDRYPYEFSGGQLQRLSIARALATAPQLIVCDEPVASLDVSIRAQVLNLLRDLQKEMGLSYLFISHDLSLVRVVAHQVAVMFSGRIVELGPTAEIFANPRHPYTRSLLAAVPVPDPSARRIRDRWRAAHAQDPGMAGAVVGCVYSARCPIATQLCRDKEPVLEPLEGGTSVACFHPLPRVSAWPVADSSSIGAQPA